MAVVPFCRYNFPILQVCEKRAVVQLGTETDEVRSFPAVVCCQLHFQEMKKKLVRLNAPKQDVKLETVLRNRSARWLTNECTAERSKSKELKNF